MFDATGERFGKPLPLGVDLVDGRARGVCGVALDDHDQRRGRAALATGRRVEALCGGAVGWEKVYEVRADFETGRCSPGDCQYDHGAEKHPPGIARRVARPTFEKTHADIVHKHERHGAGDGEGAARRGGELRASLSPPGRAVWSTFPAMTYHVFVVGPSKTGTTLLTRLLVQHPDLALLSESYVLEPSRAAREPGGTKWADHGCGDDAQRWQQLLGSGKAGAKALRTVLDEAFALLGKRKTARIVGDSWPPYPRYLRLLREAFPDAKLIHTTRDPRAVYWGGETFKGRKQGAFNCQHLLEGDRRVREIADKGADVAVVRYEELISDVRGTMSKVWEFCAVDPSAGWIDYVADRDPWPARWSWIPNATARSIRPASIAGSKCRLPCDASSETASAEYCARWKYPVSSGTTTRWRR